METIMEEKCIIQLRSVPENINGDIICSRMFLTNTAVDCILRGQMFDGYQCFWHHADLIPEIRALQACDILQEKFGIWAMIIKVH